MDDFKTHLLKGKHQYFRGESNAHWILSPALIRNLAQKGIKQTIDQSYLDEMYTPFFDVYKSKISKLHSKSRMLFYIQHAISYTPFIDITKELWVALSFALEPYQKNPEIADDIAIYTFNLKTNKRKSVAMLKTHTAIEKVLDNYSFTIHQPRKNTNATLHIIDSTELNILNDRMQYQKGAFLLINQSYYDGVDNVQSFSKSDIEIQKYIISHSLLFALYKMMKENHPHYTLEYLYNPYLLFSDLKNETQPNAML